jgi:hypothetical protein
MLLSPALALLLAAASGAEPAALAPAPPPAIVCTPHAVRIGGRTEPAEHPIAVALSRSRPGDVIQIQAGDYQPFTIGFDKQSPWNARTKGGLPGQPVTVRGVGKVRILAGSGDTIAFSQDVPNRHIVFENLTIIPSERAGLMFYKARSNQVYEGFKFYDCDILGNWNHGLDRGQSSKWGVWGHSLKDFAFVGRSRPAVIRDIRHEHAFYLQNPRGDLLIQNVQATQLGRTFCQFTARPGDGPPGVGTITVKDCVVEEVGLARGDNYKGGYAFTLAGRLTGTAIFENNVYRQGFRPELRRLTAPNVPYGTGALVAWDGGGEPNGTLVLRNNRFELAPGCGDRPPVSIGGCREVRLEGANKIVSGASKVALELDPMEGGKPRNTPIGKLTVDPKTEIEGTLEHRGRRRELADLQQQR